jgi:hypothetical protein
VTFDSMEIQKCVKTRDVLALTATHGNLVLLGRSVVAAAGDVSLTWHLGATSSAVSVHTVLPMQFLRINHGREEAKLAPSTSGYRQSTPEVFLALRSTSIFRWITVSMTGTPM